LFEVPAGVGLDAVGAAAQWAKVGWPGLVGLAGSKLPGVIEIARPRGPRRVRKHFIAATDDDVFTNPVGNLVGIDSGVVVADVDDGNDPDVTVTDQVSDLLVEHRAVSLDVGDGVKIIKLADMAVHVQLHFRWAQQRRHPFSLSHKPISVLTPRLRVGDTPLDHRPVRLQSPPDDFTAELAKAPERGQIGRSEGSAKHAKFFRTGSTRTSIREDLDPLSGQRRTHRDYTLICEEPPVSSC
jgi:hypothetical protein